MRREGQLSPTEDKGAIDNVEELTRGGRRHGVSPWGGGGVCGGNFCRKGDKPCSFGRGAFNLQKKEGRKGCQKKKPYRGVSPKMFQFSGSKEERDERRAGTRGGIYFLSESELGPQSVKLVLDIHSVIAVRSWTLPRKKGNTSPGGINDAHPTLRNFPT